MMPAITRPPVKVPVTPGNFRVPDKLVQLRTFIKRNITRKIADRQYMTINLLEAPLLALILGYISKYSEDGGYLFASNINYPVFLFMSIIVALFMGLTVSAEEIFRDRKILEREKFLNLSRLSYLFSKINFLFVLSAIQTLSFVLVANTILEVKGMLFRHWIILFSTACFGNLLGLNISAGMRSAISIYILIPLLLVPQLLLGGAMIQFDDLHKAFSRKIYVPVIGDVMTTRWAYEAISVEQFKSNRYEKNFFKYDMAISQNNWKASFLIPRLRVKAQECAKAGKNPEYKEYIENNFIKLNYHINELSELTGIRPGDWIESVNYDKFNDIIGDYILSYFDSLSLYFRTYERKLSIQLDSLKGSIENRMGKEQFVKLLEENHNERLAEFVLNRRSSRKIFETDDRFLQKADPVLMPPGSRHGRAHFYAPFKQIGNLKIGTLIFNMIFIWLMILFLFFTLYYNVLKKFIVWLEKLKLPFWRKFGREILQI